LVYVSLCKVCAAIDQLARRTGKEPAMFSYRRKIIQHHLDSIEAGWLVKKPKSDDDLDDACIFGKVDDAKEVHADLPHIWFNDGMRGYIEWEIRRALNGARKITRA
jgi:hypothetical protein